MKSLSAKISSALTAVLLMMFFFFEGFHASRAEFKEAFPRGLADLSAPMSSLEQWLEQRLTILEASFVDLSASVPRQLCVSDDFGERTCITKCSSMIS